MHLVLSAAVLTGSSASCVMGEGWPPVVEEGLTHRDGAEGLGDAAQRLKGILPDFPLSLAVIEANQCCWSLVSEMIWRETTATAVTKFDCNCQLQPLYPSALLAD